MFYCVMVIFETSYGEVSIDMNSQLRRSSDLLGRSFYSYDLAIFYGYNLEDHNRYLSWGTYKIGTISTTCWTLHVGHTKRFQGAEKLAYHT